MDVIDVLEKDHRRVEELFARFKGGGGITGLVKRVTGNVSQRERRTALESICRELTVHAAVEEEVVYPAVQATGDQELRRLVDESLREHARVKELVAELRGRDPQEEDVDTKASELQECVDHHVKEEENEMFPRLRDVMPDQRRAELGRRVQERKRAHAPRATPRRAASVKRPAARIRRGRKTATSRAKTKAAKKRSRRGR